MTKIKLKQTLNKLVSDFFASSDVNAASKIKDEIYKTVLDCPYTDSSRELLINSMTIWKVDIGNYLTTFDRSDRYFKHQAYLAMIGIITFVDLSLLDN